MASKHSLQAKFRPNKAELKSLFEALGQAAQDRQHFTTTEIGNRLEKLANFILASTSGVFQPLGSCRTVISQLDNAASAEKIPGLFIERFHPGILVECKNYAGRADKRTVDAFAAELMRTELSVGLLFAQKGITREGEFVLAMAASHGKYILVITEDHLQELISGENLFAILERLWNTRIISPA